jgi:hypothetical protein
MQFRKPTVAGPSEDARVRDLDITTGQHLGCRHGHGVGPRAVVFAGNGWDYRALGSASSYGSEALSCEAR